MISLQPCTGADFPAHDNLFQTAFWGQFKTTSSQQALFFLATQTPPETERAQSAAPAEQAALSFGKMTTSADRAAVPITVLRTAAKSVLFPFMVLLRTTPSGAVYAYAPKAPSVSVPDEQRGLLLEELSLALRPYLPENIVCIRFDPMWRSQFTGKNALRPELRELRINFGTQTGMLRKAPVDHLCPDTIVINLKPPPAQILSHMRQTTRNCVRHAYRSGVTFCIQSAVESLSTGTLAEWHDVYEQTALRKDFYYEQLPYFTRMFELSAQAEHDAYNGSAYAVAVNGTDAAPDDMQSLSYRMAAVRRTYTKTTEDSSARAVSTANSFLPLSAAVPPPHFFLCTAHKDGVLLSGLILGICGRTAYYMYSGSSLEGRDLMPNYGLQWEVMLFARSRGATSYDLMGIPPDNGSAHPMSGLYLFKTGFGGDHVTFTGAWDYVYSQQNYSTFCMEEQIGTVS